MSGNLITLGLLVLLVLVAEGARYLAERGLGLSPEWIRVLPARGSRLRQSVAIIVAPVAAYLFIAQIATLVFALDGVQSGTSRYAVDSVDPSFDAYGKLAPGDVIVAFDGQALFFEVDGVPQPHLSTLIAERMQAGAPSVRLDVQRGEHLASLDITPQLVPSESYVDAGPRYRLGIVIEIREELINPGLGAIPAGLAYPGAQLYRILGDLIAIASGTVKGDLRGPVGISHVMNQAQQEGIGTLMRLALLVLIYYGLILFAFSLCLIRLGLTAFKRQ